MEIKLDTSKVQYRDFPIFGESLKEDARSINLSFSSEEPVRNMFGFEILSHEAGAMREGRMKTGINLLVDHNPSDVVGIIENAQCDPKKKRGEAVARFGKSARAEEVFQDVKDGIRKNVSVGYMVHKLEEMRSEEMDESLAEKISSEGVPCYRVTDWEPVEISLVSVPADSTVGVGRSLNQTQTHTPEGVITMGTEDTKTPTASVQPTSDEAVQSERKRIAEIQKWESQFAAKVPNVRELAKDAIEKGYSPELFKGIVAERMASSPDAVFTPSSAVGLSEKETKQYSLRNAIMAQVPNSGVKAEFEKEVSAEIAKRMGTAPKGLFVPWEKQIEKRDLTVGSATAGGNLVQTTVKADSFIDLLRNKMLATQLGVTQLPGLVGAVAIPKLGAAATAYWVAENIAPTESQQTINQVSLTPRTVGAYTDYSRQLLMQSTPAIDGIVTNDLTSILAIAIDAAVFSGTGTAQPQGIIGYGSVATSAMTGITWANVLTFETSVATANADFNTMAYVMTPAIRGILKGKVKATYLNFMIDSDGTMNGYPTYASNQVTANYMIFGNFSQSVLGMWGGLDLLVDPYTGSSAGTVRTVAFQTVDHAIRNVGAYYVGSAITS